MSVPTGADRAYVATAEELADVLQQADNRIRLARESLEAVHQDVSRSLVALGDVDIEIRKGERGVGHPFALQQAFDDVRRRSEQASRDAGEVREHLGHSRGALAAAQVLLAGLRTPATEQERVDQEAMSTRLRHLHDSLSEILPVAEDLTRRTSVTGKLATQGRDRASSDRAEVQHLTEGAGMSRRVALDMDAPVETAQVNVNRAAAQAHAVASAARLRSEPTAALPHTVQESTSPRQWAVELDQAETLAIARELRHYSELVGGHADPWAEEHERAAELGSDPTYAYDAEAQAVAVSAAVDAVVERGRQATAAGAPYSDLANTVERTERLELGDAATRTLVRDVIENTGWRVGQDPWQEPPAAMRKVVEAFSPVNPDRGASADTVELDVHGAAAQAHTVASAARLRSAQTTAHPGTGAPVSPDGVRR